MDTALPGIRPRRRAAGLTLKDLAAAVGCSLQAISFWEQGRSMPTADRLPRLAAALGCSIEELYTVPDTGAMDDKILRCAQDDKGGPDQDDKGSEAGAEGDTSSGADAPPSPLGEGIDNDNYTEEDET